MQPTPEERQINDWAEDVPEDHPLRAKSLVIILGLFLGCLVVVLSASGVDRLIYGGMASFSAALAAPVLARDHPQLRGPAKVFKFLVGLGLVGGGLAMTGLGVFLFTAGSFGILASFILVPIGLASSATGCTLLVVREPNSA